MRYPCLFSIYSMWTKVVTLLLTLALAKEDLVSQPTYDASPDDSLWVTDQISGTQLASVDSACSTPNSAACMAAIATGLTVAKQDRDNVNRFFTNLAPYVSSVNNQPSAFDRRINYMLPRSNQLQIFINGTDQQVMDESGSADANANMNKLQNSTRVYISAANEIEGKVLGDDNTYKTTFKNYMNSITGSAAGLSTTMTTLTGQLKTNTSTIQQLAGLYSDYLKTQFPISLQGIVDQRQVLQSWLNGNITSVETKVIADNSTNVEWIKNSTNALQQAAGIVWESEYNTAIRVDQAYNDALGQIQDSLVNGIISTKNESFQQINERVLTDFSNANTSAGDLLNKARSADLAIIDEFRANLTSIYDEHDSAISELKANITSAKEALASDLFLNQSAAETRMNTVNNQTRYTLDDLATTLDKFIEIAANNSIALKTQGKYLMAKLYDMIQGVKEVLANYKGNLGGTMGEGMDSGNELLQKAIAASKVSAADAAKSAFQDAGGQLGALTGGSFDMMGAVADLLLALRDTSELLRAKVGAGADEGESSLNRLNYLVSSGTNDLSGTMDEMAAQQRLDAVKAHSQASNTAAETSRKNAETAEETEAHLESLQNGQQAMLDDYSDLAGNSVKGAANDVKDLFTMYTANTDAASAVQAEAGAVTNNLQVTALQLQQMLANAKLTSGQAIAAAGVRLKTALKAENSSLFSQLNNRNTTVTGLINELAKNYSDYLNSTSSTWQTMMVNTLTNVNATQEFADQLPIEMKNLVDSVEGQRVSLNGTMVADVLATLTALQGDMYDKAFGGSSGSSSEFQDAQMALNAQQFDSKQGEINQKFDTPTNGLYALLAQIAGAQPNADSLKELAHQVNDSMMQFSATFGNMSFDSEGQLNQAKTDDETSKQQMLTAVLNSLSTLREFRQNATNDVRAVESDVRAKIAAADYTIGLDDLRNTSAKLLVDIRNASSYTPEVLNRKVRAGTLADILKDVQTMRSGAMLTLLERAGNNTLDQQKIVSSLNALNSALQYVASFSTNNADTLAAMLSNASARAESLGQSMQNFADAGAKQMRQESQLYASNLAQQAAVSMSTAVSNLRGAGTQVLSQSDSLNATVAAYSAADTRAIAAAVGLGDSLDQFSDDTMTQLRQLLAKVNSGQMTMQQALSTAAQVDESKLSSVADLAVQFITLIEGFIGTISTTVEDAENQMEFFNKTVFADFDKMRTTFQSTFAPLAGGARRANETAQHYLDTIDGVVSNATSTANNFQAQLETDKAAAANAEGIIQSLANDAVDQINKIREDEKQQIVALISTSTSRILSKLKSKKPTMSSGWHVQSADLDWNSYIEPQEE